MKLIKDFVVSVPIMLIFLIGGFMHDDSYEDAKLSAQILDEAIAQALADHEDKISSLSHVIARNDE